jgi:hypothetical protein
LNDASALSAPSWIAAVRGYPDSFTADDRAKRWSCAFAGCCKLGPTVSTVIITMALTMRFGVPRGNETGPMLGLEVLRLGVVTDENDGLRTERDATLRAGCISMRDPQQRRASSAAPGGLVRRRDTAESNRTQR